MKRALSLLLELIDAACLAAAYPLLIFLLLTAPAWAGGLAAYLKGLFS
jgi:hypothetical protein